MGEKALKDDLKEHSEADTVLDVLNGQPSLDELLRALETVAHMLDRGDTKAHQSARITGILVDCILPAYLPLVFSKEASPVTEKLKRSLCTCLGGIAGIKAVLMRIKSLSEAQGTALCTAMRSPAFFCHIGELLAILEEILCSDGNLIPTWLRCHPTVPAPAAAALDTPVAPSAPVADAPESPEPLPEPLAVASPPSLAWNEYVSLVAGGRLLGIASQGLHTLCRHTDPAARPVFWVADGSAYARHFGREMLASLSHPSFRSDMLHAFSSLLSRFFSLGYTAQLVASLFRVDPPAVCHADLLSLHAVARLLPPAQKTLYVHTLLSSLDAARAECLTECLTALCAADPGLAPILARWLLRPPAASLALRKAVAFSYHASLGGTPQSLTLR